MITHEEARENALFLQKNYDMAYDELLDYISQQEALQTEHEYLKKDIARYIELTNIYLSNQLKFTKIEEYQEYFRLKLNLESRQ